MEMVRIRAFEEAIIAKHIGRGGFRGGREEEVLETAFPTYLAYTVPESQ